MKFWDSSAVLPLIVEEAPSDRVSDIQRRDSDLTVWCLTQVEIASALARRFREGLPLEHHAAVVNRSNRLTAGWTEVVSWDLVRSRALRVVSTHWLRAADALQLAAAIVASGERPEALPFVCLDDRLREAARKEGFPVLPA